MSTTPLVQRDEPTTAIEYASYRWAYLLMSFGLLGLVTYRSFVHHENAWDMLGLVILGGVLITAYQGFHGVQSRQWTIACLLTVAASAILAALIAGVR